MEKIRPNKFKTESEAWGEDSGRIEVIKMMLDKGYVNEDNYFDLNIIILSVSDRTSLESTDVYIERLKECELLSKKIINHKKS